MPYMTLEEARTADEEERRLYAEEQETRANSPISRRELLEALETVANSYGANGNHDGDLICNALQALAEELR